MNGKGAVERNPAGSPNPSGQEPTTPHAFTTTLAKKFGIARKDVLALTPANDPFNSGTPSEAALAAWFAETFESLDRPRIHLRDVHYQIVVRGLARHDGRVYTGTGNDWLKVNVGSRKARDLGLISPWAFTDHRTQAEYRYDLRRDRPVIGPRVARNEEAPKTRLSRPELWVPEWEIEPPTLHNVPSPLSLQPMTVEVWVEKFSDALNSEILPVAEQFGCRVVIGAGFQSKTAAADLVRRSIRDGRERVVLWLGDADAKGESMANATARHIEFIRSSRWLAEHEPEAVVPRIALDQAALTLDQLAAVEAEIGRRIPVTQDDNRDEGRVEIQALAAFAPGWVGTELRRRLEELTDPDLDDAIDDWEVEAEDGIEAAWEAETAASEKALTVLRERRDAILERFDLAALNAAIDEIEPERRRLEAEIRETIERFDPELPELPEGIVDLADHERDWLLDTDREYLDQLDAYRRHEPSHRRRPPLVLTEPTCEFCGGPLPPGRKRFCTEAHRKRHERQPG